MLASGASPPAAPASSVGGEPGAAQGVVFPVDNKGERSSTGPAKAVWSAAFAGVDAERAAALQREGNWRHNYVKHLVGLTEQSAATPELALGCATAGLGELYRQMEFVRGEACDKVPAAMAKYTGVPGSAVVRGQGAAVDAERAVGVAFGGEERATGAALVAAVEERMRRGELEPDVVAAFQQLVAHRAEWLRQLKDTVFVVLGATSELCPLAVLLELGLNVAAVARPNARRQKALLELAQRAPAGASLTVPLLGAAPGAAVPTELDAIAAACGADIITHAPEVANWLVRLAPGKRLVLGSYIYLDGADHVRASVAMDAVLEAVLKARPDAALAYLGTPAVVYPIPAAAAKDSERRRLETPWWHSLAGVALGPFEPNTRPPLTATRVDPRAKDQSKEIYMYDGINVVQGPNYMLAKTLQNWRAMLARCGPSPRIVSVNMTPMCSTESVMHVAAVARAVRGLKAFPPTVCYEPATARSLMALLLVYDLSAPDSQANPKVALRNAYDLFASCGVHGGLWRAAHTSQSTSKTAYLLDLLNLA